MYAARQARRDPGKPAIIMAASGQVVTFGEYEARANRLARFFRQQGLRRGDHIALFMENNPRMLEAEGAAERTGLYYTCVNAHLTTAEVAYIIRDCQARVVITSAAKREVADALPRQCPDVERWLMADIDVPAGLYEPYEHALRGCPAEPLPDEQLGAPMMYTSGTTGHPKGVLRPLPDTTPETGIAASDFASRVFRYREDMTFLSPTPLYHAAPQGAISGALRAGATSIIMDRFDAATFLDLVAKYRVTDSQLVPTMFARLLRLPPAVRESADVSSLAVVIHAGAPCPIPAKEQMIEWWGPIIYEYYAASEQHGMTFCDSREWLAHKGTVGRALLGEAVILDDDGRECPHGQPGTVWFRGATNFVYFNDPGKTAAARSPDGSMSTVGDIGYLDADGFLYLTDRKANVIISGGVNIYPQETENLLISHPKVMDAAVIGVPHNDLGEEVKAVIELAPGIEPGPEVAAELIGYCGQHLARFKCPRSVDFSRLPRLPNGKLYKRLLRDRYRQ